MTGWLPRRWPLVPTLLVLLAAAGMVALGVWQIDRAGQKEALVAQVRANPGKSAIRFPEIGPVPSRYLFRRSSVHCLAVDSWQVEAGRAADGSAGFRYIAHCTTGAEGPGALIAVGVGGKPDLKPRWTGGQVDGWIAEEPDHRSLLGHLTGPLIVLRPMIIATVSPEQGLKASAPPRIDDIPNNHRSYAFQWFSFAIIAILIYILALRRRQMTDARDS